MRIDRAYIEQFGPISACDIGELSANVNVVIAPDPAVRSAFRSFVRTVLFGFDDDRNDPVSRGRALARGAEGGLLELIGADGVPLTIERYRDGMGTASEKLVVSRAGEIAGPELLHEPPWHVGRSLYDAAFSLALHHGGVSDDELRRRLVSAAFGAAGADLAAALASLDAGRDAAWAGVEDCLAAHRAARSRLQDAQGELDGYGALAGRAAEMSRQLELAAERLAPLQARIHWLEHAASSRAPWNRMQDLQRQMVDMPRLAYLPSEPLKLLDALEGRRRGLESDLSAGDRGNDERQRELDDREGAVVSLPSLEQARHLWAQREEYEEAARELPRLEARLADAEQQLAAELAGLGAAADEAVLDSVDDSSAMAGRFADVDERLTQARAAAADAGTREREAHQALDDARADVVDAERRLAALGTPPEASVGALESRLEALGEAQRLYEGREAARRAVAAGLSRLAVIKPRWSVPVLRLIPLIQLGLSIGFVAAGGVTWALALIAGDASVVRTGQLIAATGVVGIALSVAVLQAQRRHRRRETEAASDSLRAIARAIGNLRGLVDEAKRREEAAATSFQAAFEGLGMDGEASAAELETESERVSRRLERRARCDAAAFVLQDAAEAAERASLHATDASTALREAESRQSVLEADWEGLARRAGLPSGLAPGAGRLMLDRIPGIRALRSEVRDLRVRVPRLRQTIQRVETELCELKESAGVPGFDPGGAGPLLADLADRYRETAATRDKVGGLRRAVEAWPARRAELERELASVQREHAELLDLAGVSVSEEFRRVAGREEERRAYSDELQELRRTANDLSGPDGREIEEQFRSVSVEEASAELAGLRDRVRDLEELRARLRLRLAEVEQQMERLSGPPRTVDIRIEIDRIADEGRGHARAWAVRALAERLTGEAVQEFRRERQPERLRLAGEYLERLSGGRYVAVRPCSGSQPVGPDALEIVGSNGRPIPLARLARAGIEQACLAVRLAAAHDRATRQETLPVILDDVPAHLGPDLAPGGVAAVTTLAGTTQVFLLTGRASTAELMRGARGVGRLRVIDIGAEGRQLPLSA